MKFKDFDLERTGIVEPGRLQRRFGIATLADFQKWQRIERNKRLDEETMIARRRLGIGKGNNKLYHARVENDSQ